VLLFFLLVAGVLFFVGLLNRDSEPPAVPPSIAKTTLNHNRADQSVTIPATPPEKQDDHPVNLLASYRAKTKEGYAYAMVNLGLMYDDGEGVIQDYEEAVKWYRKAVELGHTGAMSNLGAMYTNGSGVIEDDVEAYAWSNVAAAKGDKMGAKTRDKIKKFMTPEQIAEGQKRSREIMKLISKN